MKIFKAFAQIGPLTDNTDNVVAPVGELAPMSRTFVRGYTEYVHSDFPGDLTLIGFSYKEEDVKKAVPDATSYACLKVISWVYAQARLGKFTEQKDSFQQFFIQTFGTQFDLVSSGEHVAFGNYWSPEYIEFAPYQQDATTRWRVWFSDDAFYNQFDEFQHMVVPPVVPVDQFFDDFNGVTDLVAGIKQADIFDRIRVARGKFPETVLRTDMFQWHDRNDKTLTVDTDWVTVIYGAAGDNLDATKEAIRQYIMANTTHTRDEWAVIFPDLFTSTEFIFTPMATDYAVPNGDRDHGIYSGQTSIQKAIRMCRKTCKGVKYTNAHIDKVICIVPTQFRSIMCSVVGGPENRDGIDLFMERYPDYINVSFTHQDFMAMSEETRQFCYMLAEMLMHAEEMTVDSGVPQGYNRIIRDGIVYIAKSFKNFLYLVVAFSSVKATGVV